MSDPFDARDYLENYDGPDFRIMEVCGTHTHEIFRQGIRRILSPKIKLISGPGCPVCVTPVSFIDEAVYLALEKGCTITTFGDLVRVPGSSMSLAGARAKGASVKVVYSPLDAVKYAASNPDEQVVFLSVGFETTTPSDVMAVKKAMTEKINTEPLAQIDYVEVVDGVSMQPIEEIKAPALVAIAVKIGKTRLIDNTIVND